MNLKFICPYCQQKYELDASCNGQIVQCTRCQRDFTLVASQNNEPPSPCNDGCFSKKQNSSYPWHYYYRAFSGIMAAAFSYFMFHEEPILAIVLVYLWLFFAFYPFYVQAPKKHFVICPNPNCGFRGETETQNAANGCLVVPLLLLGIIPGLLYIIACGGMHKIICPKCGMRIR